MFVEFLKTYLAGRFGVTSLKPEVNSKRVLFNVLAVLFAFAGLIAFGSLETEITFVDALPAGLLFVVSAVLFIKSDVPLNMNLLKSKSVVAARKSILDGLNNFLEYPDVDNYNESDVDECGVLLSKLMFKLSSKNLSREIAMRHVKDLVESLNSLNDKTGMIETDEREGICDFIELCLMEAGIEFDGDVTEKWREW